MICPTAVEPREGFRIWLRYSDGVSGELDLSHLAGRGVFAAWDEPGSWGGKTSCGPPILMMQAS